MKLSEIKKALVTQLKKKDVHAEIKYWRNFMGTVESPSAVILEIHDTDKAIKAMRIIYDYNSKLEHPLTIRAVAGWQDKTWCPLISFFSNIISGPTERYNESYTANPSGVADIIFRFAPAFQKNKLKMLENGKVQIPAGLQMKDLESFLNKKGRSIGTATMINKVSCVGAVMNGCQGTGRDQPTLSGLVTELTILKPDGNIARLSVKDDNFDTLIGANLGLTGVVLSMTMSTEAKFNLLEQVKHYTSLNDLKEDLNEKMAHDYFTIMITPLYGIRTLDDQYIPNIQVRTWDRTDEKARKDRDVHDYTVEDLAMEISTQVGGEVQNLLLKAGQTKLLEGFLALTAFIIALQRGEDDHVSAANNVMHYQRAFPRDLNVVSFQLSVPEEKAGDYLYDILLHSEALLREMNEENAAVPVTYSTYVRYINGTSGGLSTCPQEPDHKVLIVEYVTNTQAPGFDELINAMIQFYHDNEWSPKFHLGKGLPLPIPDFIDNEQLNQFWEALTQWYDNNEAMAFKKNPMFSPFLKQHFGLSLSKRENRLLTDAAAATADPGLDNDQTIEIIAKLMSMLKKRKTTCDAEDNAIHQFCQMCQDTIDELKNPELSVIV